MCDLEIKNTDLHYHGQQLPEGVLHRKNLEEVDRKFTFASKCTTPPINELFWSMQYVIQTEEKAQVIYFWNPQIILCTLLLFLSLMNNWMCSISPPLYHPPQCKQCYCTFHADIMTCHISLICLLTRLAIDPLARIKGQQGKTIVLHEYCTIGCLHNWTN